MRVYIIQRYQDEYPEIGVKTSIPNIELRRLTVRQVNCMHIQQQTEIHDKSKFYIQITSLRNLPFFSTSKKFQPED